MWGITFEGRYTRKQFWLMTLLIVVLHLLLHPLVWSVQKDATQTLIITEIIREKGRVTPADIEEFRNKLVSDTSFNESQKVSLEIVLNRLENMSQSELIKASDVYLLSTHAWLLAIFLLLSGFYLFMLTLSVWIRRGHDLDISGLTTTALLIMPVACLFTGVVFIILLAAIIPIIFFIYYGFFSGDFTDNDYGPPPL